MAAAAGRVVQTLRLAALILPADGAVLVAIGAVPGAWLRFLLVNRLEPLLPRRHWGTLCVNGLACLLLGWLTASHSLSDAGSQRLQLLLATGFLGSLSTFSTFIGEMHAVVRRGLRREAALLLFGTLLLGLTATAAGLALGGR